MVKIERNLGDQVIRKGYLSLQQHANSRLKHGATDFWFVLTSDSLSWFKDNEESDKQFMIPLDGLKIKGHMAGGGFMSRRHSFIIYNMHGKNVYRDWKTLELSGDTQDSVDSWKASFLRAGVFPDKDNHHTNGNGDENGGNNLSISPQLQRQVETIRNLVDSYMKIVKRTCRDIVPKTIMLPTL